MKVTKAHCFFEQSGTFKNEFKKLGIEAEDYDILNDFGETDNVVDLMKEIAYAYYLDEKTVFDYIHKYGIEYNPLYDKGFSRVGCIGCPIAGKRIIEEFKKYPKYKALYKKLSDEIEKELPNNNWQKNSKVKYTNLFDWWIQSEE